MFQRPFNNLSQALLEKKQRSLTLPHCISKGQVIGMTPFLFKKKKIMQCAVSVCVGGMGKSVLINYISSSVLCFRHGMLDSKSKRSSVQVKSEILFESKDDIETSR